MNSAHKMGKPCKKGHSGLRYKKTGRCVECHAECVKAWGKKNKDKINASKRRYRAKGPIREKEYAKEYYAKNLKDNEEYKAAKREYDREYRRKNREKIDARVAKWREENPDRISAIKNNYKHKRRTVKKLGVSTADYREWLIIQDRVCFWCGTDCDDSFHVDHYVPISKGGLHEIENLVIACPSCNYAKNSKMPEEFAKELRCPDGYL